ncbi:hypothetical protein BDZ45DRAFT_715851 [Acephala macrosclerotiorum]|nr:hypothetical protein BDZ45DRAFT_715851 [Acephala macrosclerotiorum]
MWSYAGALDPAKRVVLCRILVLLISPFYTFGSPSNDYYNFGPFLAMVLWYLDFVILTPRNGEGAPVFLGPRSSISNKDKSKNLGQGWEEKSSIWQKLRWAFRLMIPCHRGIGWNWQVKSVPPNPDLSLAKWTYVRKHLQVVIMTYLRSTAMLVLLGFCFRLQKDSDFGLSGEIMLNTAISWTGAIWIWDRLSGFYSLTAALSVATGLCEIWEWPPLMGKLSDAWSVRQMWSGVYHQNMRRMLSQPAIRIAKFLRLRKGTLASKYSQLYISFGISCLFHQFQMFNVTRHDTGEFKFFMSQAVAVTAEDLVMWAWRKLRGRRERKGWEKNAGYIWVFAWFSYSLQLYIKGLRDNDIMYDIIFGLKPLGVGKELGGREVWHRNHFTVTTYATRRGSFYFVEPHPIP